MASRGRGKRSRSVSVSRSSTAKRTATAASNAKPTTGVAGYPRIFDGRKDLHEMQPKDLVMAVKEFVDAQYELLSPLVDGKCGDKKLQLLSMITKCHTSQLQHVFESEKDKQELPKASKKRRHRKLKEQQSRPSFRPLSEEQEERVRKAVGAGSEAEVLVEAFGVGITRHDIRTIEGSEWLNDEVINCYLKMLEQAAHKQGNPVKAHFMNTFFYTKLSQGGYNYKNVQRWTKKVDLFAQDVVVIPLHRDVHWCVATINLKKKRFEYFDSLRGDGSNILQILRRYLCDESLDKCKMELDPTDWQDMQHAKIPKQLNGCDCGVFTCKFIQYISTGKEFDWEQKDMNHFRNSMILEILDQHLLQDN